ncbi:uncharacterized protein [Dysidea avara]|uniref:uncharacterized protein isoform X3 n=1 Tax=Dysidea avara TaxID=196820 RepID=UPI003317750B
MVPIISHRRFATSDKMAASSGAHICDTDRLQDGIVISSRVVAPRNLPAIRSIATTREEEVVQRNDNVEDAVTITATQSGGVVMQPGGVLRQSGVLPEGSGAACIQLPGSHTSCNAASFFSFNPFAVHREGQMDAATLPGGVVMQPGGVIRQSGALPGIQQAGLRLNNYKHHSEGSGAACIQLPGSHTSCNAASFFSFNPFAVHREGQMDAATLPGGVVMQPGGVIRQSGALPGIQQAGLRLNNYKHHSEGSGAACIQLPGSHTSCNAASFPSFNSIAVHREGQMDAATLPGGVVMQPGGVLRQSGVLPGMQQAGLRLNNYKNYSEGSGAACIQLPGSHTSCNAASFFSFNPFAVHREGQMDAATLPGGVVMQPGGVIRQSGALPEGSGAACIQLPGSHTSCNAASFPSFNSIAVHREGQMDAATLPGGVVMQPGGVLRQSGVLPEGSGAACVQLPGSHTSCNAASFPAFNPFLVRTALREGQTVLGSGATVQSSCIPTSCSIVSVAGDLPLKVMEGHSEISRDDVIEPERITATQSSSSLTSYISQGESHYEDLCFIPRKCSDSASSRPILEVIQKTTFDVPPAGHISVARVLLYRMEASYKYETQVLFTTINNGTISTAKEFLDACGVISEKNGYKFCPGLNVQHYHEYFFAVIRYHLESCRLWEHPFKRVDSKNCSLWHKLPVQALLKDRSKSAVLCRGCKRLNTNLEHQRKRSDVSPAKRAKRLLPSSSFKLKYLSPKSVAKRKQATQRERSRDKVAIAEANNEVVLEDDQSDEVNQIMQTIESEAATELDEVLKEMPTGRSIWNDDKRNPKAEFFKDQRLNRNGKKQNQWSTITIRIALAVFVRSPAAYEALKSFNILQLPSRSTLQAYTGAFLHEAGAAAESIAKQVEMYAASVAKCKKEGKLTPQSDGTLIFDEVKVVSGLIWNSRSQ